MNSIAEISAADAAASAKSSAHVSAAATLHSESLDAVSAAQTARFATGMPELDRVLGGGLPVGAAVLIGGEPGIGKSTLLAQVAGAVGRQHPVLYATAEESTAQVRDRCHRVGISDGLLRLVATGDARALAGAMMSGEHRLVVIDSIQLMTREDIDGEPGGVSQIRGCAATLVEAAKRSGTSLVIVGHVTKDGGLAGPRLLEHLVDTVLSF